MALPGVVDYATMAAFVKDHLAKAPSEMLQPHWDSAINAGIITGYWTCVNAWIARGYTVSQVNAWDRLAEFQLEIGAWFVLKRLSAMMPDSVSQANLDALDRRGEMVCSTADSWGRSNGSVSQAVLTINGVAVDGDGTYGQVGTGAMDTTQDMFVLPASNTDDSRIGTLTRF